MKIGKILIIMGTITSIFGTTFHLQGQSIIGPKSSFMYSSPEWIGYGMQILTAGIIILCAGFVIVKKK
ncbi:hypothetical protein K0U27_03995 [archaeon]|nr:hypothetical protein [archaeon]